jgi:hypothetical protein
MTSSCKIAFDFFNFDFEPHIMTPRWFDLAGKITHYLLRRRPNATNEHFIRDIGRYAYYWRILPAYAGSHTSYLALS